MDKSKSEKKTKQNTNGHQKNKQNQTEHLFQKKIYRTRLYHQFTISPMGGTSPISLELFFLGIWEMSPFDQGETHNLETKAIGENIRSLGALTHPTPARFNIPRPGPMGSIHHFFWMLYGFLPEAKMVGFPCFSYLCLTGRSAFLFGCTCPRGHRRLDLAEFVESLE